MGNNELRTKYVNKALEVIDCLSNGVEDENGNVRNFDIIDYYQICRTTPARLFEITSKALERVCTREEYDMFFRFTLKHGNSPKITIKEIMEIKHSMIINDELREITEEEKLEAIKMVIDNKMKLTSDVYFAALKRELNNNLSLEKENVKTLKK